MRNKCCFIVCFLCLLMVGFAQSVQSQNRNVELRGELKLERITGEIQLDGNLDESDWSRLQPLELTVFEPVYKGRYDGADANQGGV